MAFLDNSGDIILDAVLTDHGRKLLAQGDGSFEITQFALADDEIDYSLYEKNHASGSAYHDIQILQTPVFEAFTNNTSSVKNKLVSFENLELLFLPIIKINTKVNATAMHGTLTNTFVVAVDSFTEDDNGSNESLKGVVKDENGVDRQGMLRGQTLLGNYVRIDQGLDTATEGTDAEISPTQSLGNMVETEYTVQMDSRLGHLSTVNGDILTEDYIDDDHIAFYTVSQGDTTNQIVSLINNTDSGGTNTINGPRGTKLEFKVKSSMELQTSTFLLQRLGATDEMLNREGSSAKSNVYYVDTMIRVTGVKTGQSIDVPIRFVKYKST